MVVLLATALVATALAASLCVRAVVRLAAGRPRRATPPSPVFDPGRERRAEQRARELLRSCVNECEWEMYRDLGLIRIAGQRLPDAGGSGDGAPYAYLIYPHKPIVAYVPATGEMLSEYCVQFPDRIDGRPTRLPSSDDVLAKWMAITSDEARVIGRANVNLIGRQHDPARLRRDIWRLGEWDRRRQATPGAGTRAA